MEVESLLTPQQVADRKGVSRAAVHAAIAEGRLPCRKVLNRRAVHIEDADNWHPVKEAVERGRLGGRARVENDQQRKKAS